MDVYEREDAQGDKMWRSLNVSEEVWQQLLANGLSPETILLSKTLPIAILHTFSLSPDVRIRSMVADKRAAHPLLERLATDEDASVRLRVACNAKAPSSVLKALVGDPEPLVREAAISRLARMNSQK